MVAVVKQRRRRTASPVSSSSAVNVTQVSGVDVTIKSEHVSSLSSMGHHVLEVPIILTSSPAISASSSSSSVQQKPQPSMPSDIPSVKEGSTPLEESRILTKRTFSRLGLGAFKDSIVKEERDEEKKTNGAEV